MQCQAGNGVGVLDPEALPVAADGDVVSGEDGSAEAVFDGGEGGDTAGVVGDSPDSDLGILVGCEECEVVKGD